ncbi:MAG: HD domain-containing protein [Rubricoccaceae bacterium]
MSTLERAIVIAAEAHAGVRDKGGAPYILHPLRLMLGMSTEAEQIAAVLHDVVEDSDWTLDQLRAEGFSEEIVRAVDHVTRCDDETYAEFVQRAGEDPVAARVKAADLIDNMDVSRIASPTAKDHERIAKYERALATLRSGPYVS